MKGGNLEYPPREDFTEILLAQRSEDTGGRPDVNQIFEAVYTELRDIAAGLMRRDRPDQTLQPTALVNEAYVRLVDQARVGWENRAHFFGTAARAMRQILVDQARSRCAGKRGGGWQQITLDERVAAGAEQDIELLDLDNALTRLALKDERMARVVELRIFGGMSAKEVAHVLGVSRQTVQEDWRMSRMWLSRELSEGSAS